MTPVLTSPYPVTMIGGGSFTRADLDLALSLAPRVMAADGGADAALRHMIMPSAVVGDFDSISEYARQKIPAKKLFPVAEQDSTDFEKCLQRLDAPLAIAIGFSGTRHDHFLGALNVLARRVGPPCILLAGEDAITLLPPNISLDLEPETRVSLFPMGPATGRSQGLFWPIDGINFAVDGRIGTSNKATGAVEISMTGSCLLILPRSQTARLAAAL